MSDALHIERRPEAWFLTLNRPEKRNALSDALVEELIAGLGEAHAESVPMLVFRGAGKNFSAGFDFSGYQDKTDGDLALNLVRIEQMLQAIAHWPGLTIALAHGRNFGAGVDLFAACKRRYCLPDASFSMPGVKFGLSLGTRRFQNIVGTSHARSILTGVRVFDAHEALAMGFVQKIVSETEWTEVVKDDTSLATLLDHETRAALHRILDNNDDDADLADLVRSIARPGLKERIAHYLRKAG